MRQTELEAVQKNMKNINQALKVYAEILATSYKALEGFEGEVGKGQLAQAKNALEKGDISLAERLLQEVLDRGSLAQKAEAAFQLGSLAESRIDYGQADKYYHQAVQLQPDNPQYLNAEGNLAKTLGKSANSEQLLNIKRSLESEREKIKAEATRKMDKLNGLQKKNDLSGLSEMFNNPDGVRQYPSNSKN